jgi:hypothetical protein
MEFGQQLFFYMPQSWDMGQIILLPIRRKVCCGRLRSGADPRSWVPETSMLTIRPPNPLPKSMEFISIFVYVLSAVRAVHSARVVDVKQTADMQGVVYGGA